MTTSLQAIATKAAQDKEHRFRSLYGMLNEERLRETWPRIRKDAAVGVDKVSAAEYEASLDANVADLVLRLKEKRYRAPQVRRVYIPKANGKLRPLGIPTTEDKLLQAAVKEILEAIYEADFLPCSYGYRPGRGALDAVRELTRQLQFGGYRYVVEADIRGFFDNLDHDWLVKMLLRRIDDRPFMRLVQKWLKAGVLDTSGQVVNPATGTPQGGIVSPILANVYLHFALDLWFEKVVKPRCRGAASLIRYADDFVAAFAYEEDARQFHEALEERMAKFGLALADEKTRVIPFDRTQGGKTSFDFLSFEFRWGKDRSGKPHLKRQTARSRLRRSLQTVKAWCMAHRHVGVAELLRRLNAKLRGYYNYYGVIGNSARLGEFYQRVLWHLRRALRRRSQRHRYGWAGYQAMLDKIGIAKPRITERPRARPTARPVPAFAEARTLEEPGAGKPHAGICAGAAR